MCFECYSFIFSEVNEIDVKIKSERIENEQFQLTNESAIANMDHVNTTPIRNIGQITKIKSPLSSSSSLQSPNKKTSVTPIVSENKSEETKSDKIKKVVNFNQIKKKFKDSCNYLQNNVNITFKLIRIITSVILFTISIFLFLLTIFQDKDIFQQIIHLFIENIEITNSKNGRPI